MRRFKFRLETALRLRKLAEQEALGALAEAERLVVAARDALVEAQAVRAAHERRCATVESEGSVDMAWLIVSSQYAEALDGRIKDALRRLASAGRERDLRLATFAERRAEREALEKLREKQLQEHREESAREEQAFLDETSSLRRAA